jgi:histidyl-tRNA synthetase
MLGSLEAKTRPPVEPARKGVMNIYQMIGRNIDVTDAMRTYAEDKLAKLDKFSDQIVDAKVVMSYNESIGGQPAKVEVQVNVPNGLVRAEERGLDHYAAIDLVVDKLERMKPEDAKKKLAAFGLTPADIEQFIASPDDASFAFEAIREDLAARGMEEFIELDLSIVRGLAYYTGVVFEVFDARKSMRAVAGGGRYDTLVATLSNGKVDMPATGFAMGDYVIRQFIEENPDARMQMEIWLQRQAAACDVYLVLADDSKRVEALGILAELRENGISCDLAMNGGKLNKQFQRAEQSGARFALVVGPEWPEMKLKVLASRAEEACHALGLADWLGDRLQQPDGPLLA